MKVAAGLNMDEGYESGDGRTRLKLQIEEAGWHRGSGRWTALVGGGGQKHNRLPLRLSFLSINFLNPDFVEDLTQGSIYVIGFLFPPPPKE